MKSVKERTRDKIHYDNIEKIPHSLSFRTIRPLEWPLAVQVRRNIAEQITQKIRELIENNIHLPLA
jgi:hypothetical protein